MIRPWEPGRVVVRRHFMRDGLLARAWAARVAKDDEHGLWLWIESGSPYANVAAADGRRFREVPFGQWQDTPKRLNQLRWRGRVLMLHPREGDHSIWFFFSPHDAFNGWYINLELPVVRWDDGTTAGVDTLDYDLDIVAAPDRSWRWKDEDEFTLHLANPEACWYHDEVGIRAEGVRLVKLLEAGEFPFDGTGTDYRPDPQWTIPALLPAGWDRPQAVAVAPVTPAQSPP